MNLSKLLVFIAFVLFFIPNKVSAQTVVEIKGDQFYINGKPTYPGRTWNGFKVEGLLINSRMVQGIFDDLNPESVNSFAYPDTKKWDAKRNNKEFVVDMPEWNKYGLNSFTLNMQGGSQVGYGASKCFNTGFNPDGSLMKPTMKRLDNILKKSRQIADGGDFGNFLFWSGPVFNQRSSHRKCNQKPCQLAV